MAAFTQLERDDLTALAARYALPPAIRGKPIEGGVENSNYLLLEAGGDTPRWVLTLVEQADQHSETIAELQRDLAGRGLPVPGPLPQADGRLVGRLRGRAAILYPFVAGHHPRAPQPQHCRVIGSFLGVLHQTPWPAGLAPIASRSYDWIMRSGGELLPSLAGTAHETLKAELAFQAAMADAPQDAECTCHGDLFHDNALFQDQRLLAVIDWHNAGLEPGLYDLAIAATDWCRNTDGSLDQGRLSALLAGYRQHRRLDAGLPQALPGLLRRAALRFWLSRMIARRQPLPAAATVQHKDPEEYFRLLQFLQRTPLAI